MMADQRRWAGHQVQEAPPRGQRRVCQSPRPRPRQRCLLPAPARLPPAPRCERFLFWPWEKAWQDHRQPSELGGDRASVGIESTHGEPSPAPTPRCCSGITSSGKRGFADLIQIISQWSGDYPVHLTSSHEPSAGRALSPAFSGSRRGRQREASVRRGGPPPGTSWC